MRRIAVPAHAENLKAFFPNVSADLSPYDEGRWGLTLEFDDIGYVSDEETADDDSLLHKHVERRGRRKQMARRKRSWCVGVGRLGRPPRYDAVDPKLHWAKHPRFSDTDTLNYNISALGCRSVLIINVVAAIDELPAVFAAAPKVMSMVSFNGATNTLILPPELTGLRPSAVAF